MERTPVTSSNIKEVGYDADSLTLEVQFHSGVVWQYVGVTPERHAALMMAPSIGKHFHAHVKSRHDSRKVDSQVDSSENVKVNSHR